MENENLMLAARQFSFSLPLSLPHLPLFSFCLHPPFPLFLLSSSSFSSFFLLSLPLTPLPVLAEPNCIQQHQSPYMAAQLNMSHIIYPQQAVRSPFTAHTWVAWKKRKGKKNRVRNCWMTLAMFPHNVTLCIDTSVWMFVCQQMQTIRP